MASSAVGLPAFAGLRPLDLDEPVMIGDFFSRREFNLETNEFKWSFPFITSNAKVAGLLPNYWDTYHPYRPTSDRRIRKVNAEPLPLP